jgi:hypothetical protein
MCAASAAYSCDLGGVPAQDDLILGACSARGGTLTPGSGFTAIAATAVTFGGFLDQSYEMFYRFAGASEPSSPTPCANSGGAGGVVIYDIGGLSSTVLTDHYTAGPQVTDNTAGVLTRSASVTSTGNVLALADAHFCASLVGTATIASMKGLGGTPTYSASQTNTASCVTGGQAGGLILSAIVETMVASAGGVTSGSLLNISDIHN